MLGQNPRGVVLSTDEYFTRNGQYQFEPNLLGEAHEWNHQRGEITGLFSSSQIKMSGDIKLFPFPIIYYPLTRQSDFKR